LCRRTGIQLYLKGDRSYSDKSAIVKKAYPPGAHGGNYRQKVSEYGLQLREKQKVKYIYGLLEKQFRRTFAEAQRRKGMTGEVLLTLLERRLDNVVYRMGFAVSRPQARQLVTHGHVLLNGKKANTPSQLVDVDDVVSLKEKSRTSPHVVGAMESARRRGSLSWIQVDANNFSGKLVAEPKREELTQPPIQEQLIVEYYSR
jgi:small subunit ribosomal protein S4